MISESKEFNAEVQEAHHGPECCRLYVALMEEDEDAYKEQFSISKNKCNSRPMEDARKLLLSRESSHVEAKKEVKRRSGYVTAS